MSVCRTATNRRKAARQEHLGPKKGRAGRARSTANIREVNISLGAAKKSAKMGHRK
jgi:hypothetical protein